MKTSQKSIFRSDLFELGIFRAEPQSPGELRQDVARSHLMVFPRTATLIQRESIGFRLATPVRAVLYNRGCEYRARVVAPDHELTHFVRLRGDVLADAIRGHDPSVDDHPDRPLSVHEGPLDDQSFLRQSRLMAAAASGTLDPLRADEAIVAILGRVVGAAYAREGTRPVQPRSQSMACIVFEIEKILAARFRENMSLTELSRKAGVSAFHLCRTFKERTGSTMYQFRQRLRMRCAVDELAEPDADLARIGLGLGYSSQSHFTSVFQRTYGTSPGRARRLLRDGHALERSA